MAFENLTDAPLWIEDLQAAIVAQNFLPESGTAVVIGPPSDDDSIPDLCLGLVDRPGPVDHTYGATYTRPNLTIVCRSAPFAPRAAYLILDDVFLWLTSQANVQFGDSKFLWFEGMMSPGRLRLDAKNRTDVTCEIGVWRDELAPSTAV